MGADGLYGEGLLLTRIALLERRLQSLTRLVLDLRGTRTSTEGPSADGLAAEVVIEPDSQSELALGFHHREHDAAGNPFRWAGKADHFELRFHLDRFAARPFRMLGQFAAGVRPDQIRAYVDYRSIPVKVECEPGAEGTTAMVTGRIPADPLAGATTLTFHCPAVASPNPLDQRKLSFAFVRLIAGEAPALREAA
jgi:hypothetical protein